MYDWMSGGKGLPALWLHTAVLVFARIENGSSTSLTKLGNPSNYFYNTSRLTPTSCISTLFTEIPENVYTYWRFHFPLLFRFFLRFCCQWSEEKNVRNVSAGTEFWLRDWPETVTSFRTVHSENRFIRFHLTTSYEQPPCLLEPLRTKRQCRHWWTSPVWPRP